MSNRSHGWAFRLGAAMVGLVVGVLIWGNQRVDGKKITTDPIEHAQDAVNVPKGLLLNGKKIAAGEVKSKFELDAIGRVINNITGSFMVSSSTPGIASDGTGGACLVADLNPELPEMLSATGRKCHKNADCNGGDLKERGWAGYCDTKGADGGPKNTCWVRPGPQDKKLCNISAFAQPPKVWGENDWNDSNLSFNVTNPIMINGTPRRLYKWRVVACLNGVEKVYDPEDNVFKPACGVKDAPLHARMEIFGPIMTIPPNVHPSVPTKMLPPQYPPAPPPPPEKNGPPNPM